MSDFDKIDNEFDRESSGYLELEKKSFDKFIIGFSLSAVLTCVVLYLLTKNYVGTVEGMEAKLSAIYALPNFTTLMIGAIFPSMFLFFFFYKTDRFQSGKGLIVAVLLAMVFVVMN